MQLLMVCCAVSSSPEGHGRGAVETLTQRDGYHVVPCPVVSRPDPSRGVAWCRVVSCRVGRVVSRRIMSCRVASCRVVSCRVVSCRVVSCRVASCRVPTHRVVSHRVVWCRVVCVVSCRVASCHVASRRIASCPLRRVVSCRFAWHRVVSCRVVSCRVVSCRVAWHGVPRRVASCRAVSRRVVSHCVMSCRVVSRGMACHVVLCGVLSCRVAWHIAPRRGVSQRALACRVVWCGVVTCRVAACRGVSRRDETVFGRVRRARTPHTAAPGRVIARTRRKGSVASTPDSECHPIADRGCCATRTILPEMYRGKMTKGGSHGRPADTCTAAADGPAGHRPQRIRTHRHPTPNAPNQDFGVPIPGRDQPPTTSAPSHT